MSGEASMRVIDLITTATAHMEEKGFDNARLEVERLLGHVLKSSRIDLYMVFERPVSGDERDRFRALYRRRLMHEPLQHILGVTGFHNITVKTDRRALIPRPETEVLTETAIEALVRFDNPYFADLGTGSGVITLSILNAVPEARALAVDIDENALELARENAAILGLSERVTFIQGDMTEVLLRSGPFDMIVSNPPYIASGEIDTLQPEVRNCDPRVALDGGTDGLMFYRLITENACAALNPGGALVLECGEGQAAEIVQLLTMTGRYTEAGILRDLAGRDRIIRVNARGKE
jgi:release factor glutamine methyltransferase